MLNDQKILSAITAIFEDWVINNIDSTVVPADEGNSEALIYNIIHRLRGDGKIYNYEEEQKRELASWIKEEPYELLG